MCVCACVRTCMYMYIHVHDCVYACVHEVNIHVLCFSSTAVD